MRLLTRTFFTILLLSLSLSAQQTPYVVGSTVSGHVYCNDTNGPARFARILLKSTSPSHAGEDMMKSIMDSMTKIGAKSGEPAKPQTDEQKKALAAASKSMDQVTDMLGATTVGIDGSYSFAGVKAGTYYVHAIFPGYLDTYSQFSEEDFASTDPAVRARIAQVPTITVSGTDSARADVRLERGAAISGHIEYDDGNPASGWTLTVVKPNTAVDPGEDVAAAMAPALAMGGLAQLAKTDDRGYYRISGLAPGEYVLRASLSATAIGINSNNMGDGGSGIKLVVYSGDTFSRADAKPIKLIAGDEQTDYNITVPSHHLHNIAGHVVAKSDGHTLNVGEVNITVKDHPALPVMAAIRDDGSFHFEYLPGNITYTLTVADAADGTHEGPANNIMGISMPNTQFLHKYGTDTTDVVLSDKDVDSVTLSFVQTDWKPTPKKPSTPVNVSPGDLIKGLMGAAAGDDDDDDSSK
jgi:hypothetical protein